MLYEVMKSIKNFFIEGEYKGEWEVVNGVLNLHFLKENQYFIIEGSTFNDGVHTANDVLKDETFKGYIFTLAIPDDFLELVKEIEAYQEKYADKIASPYTSESFDGYSYSKSSANENSSGVSWKTVFNSRLNPWRKL